MLYTHESKIGKNAIIDYKPMQPGDVVETFADIEKSKLKLAYSPKIKIKEGISHFLDWYQIILQASYS